jgi:aspartate 1-decarboxylase
MARSRSIAKMKSWLRRCCAAAAKYFENKTGNSMQRIMLRAKIHRATVTQCDLHYEGSCGIDENLLEAANIREFEKIELYDINNGERFSTYAIRGKRGSGEISLNGAAARRAHLGDLLIICTYAPMNESEIETYQPKIVFVDENNQITGLKK